MCAPPHFYVAGCSGKCPRLWPPPAVDRWRIVTALLSDRRPRSPRPRPQAGTPKPDDLSAKTLGAHPAPLGGVAMDELMVWGDGRPKSQPETVGHGWRA